MTEITDPTKIMHDLASAQVWLAQHGMNFSWPQMRRIMATKKLPFRKGPNGRTKFTNEAALMKFLEMPAE